MWEGGAGGVLDNGRVNEPTPLIQPVSLGQARLLPDLDRPGAWLLTVDEAPQSYVDLEDPLHLEFEYVQRIAHVLDAWAPQAKNVLHLGGGGMSMPRYLAATRPHVRQQVVEVDRQLAELVLERLPLSPDQRAGVTVRVQDAWEALEAAPAAGADVVCGDVFNGARVPAHLTTLAYARAVARVLRPSGLYVANLADKAPFTFLRGQLATFAEMFAYRYLVAEPGVLRGRRYGNAVLVASRTLLPPEDLARRVASDAFAARVVYGEALEEFVGGADPVRVGRTSPPPPRGAFRVS